MARIHLIGGEVIDVIEDDAGIDAAIESAADAGNDLFTLTRRNPDGTPGVPIHIGRYSVAFGEEDPPAPVLTEAEQNAILERDDPAAYAALVAQNEAAAETEPQRMQAKALAEEAERKRAEQNEGG